MTDRFPATAAAVPDWRRDAACRDVDPEIFFPPGGPASPDHPANAAALLACAPCPVRVSCLLYALDALPYGVAGGLTADQRRDLRRALRARHPSARARYHGGDQGAARARGIALLRSGRLSHEAIADQVGVSIRTVGRWAASPERAAAPDLASLAACYLATYHRPHRDHHRSTSS